MPILSVIIPTCHRNDLLAKCLTCLSPGNQLLSTDEYELIVTDDGRDTTAETMVMEQFPWVKWTQGPQRGPAANRNNGAKQAEGKWLVFTDDDCLPDVGWLNEFYLAIGYWPTVSVFEGKTVADRPKQRYDEEAPVNEQGGNLWSCNFCMSTECFKKLNGFDENFPFAAMEDVDLNTRLKISGIKTVFIAKALVIHPMRLMSKGQYTKSYESFAYYLHKHNYVSIPYRIGRLKHLIYSLVTNTKRLVDFSFKGWRFYLRENWMYVKLIFLK